jgi:hypothetical protein
MIEPLSSKHEAMSSNPSTTTTKKKKSNDYGCVDLLWVFYSGPVIFMSVFESMYLSNLGPLKSHLLDHFCEHGHEINLTCHLSCKLLASVAPL